MAYYYTKSSIKMANLTIAYNMGGLFDQEGQKGISHLMEHLVCKTFKDEYAELQKYDIEFNACTGDDMVKVYFNGMEKYIQEHNIKDKEILFVHTGGTPLFFDALKSFHVATGETDHHE